MNESEFEKLKEGVKCYITLRNCEQNTPEEVFEKLGKLDNKEYEAGHLISSIIRDTEKTIVESLSALQSRLKHLSALKNLCMAIIKYNETRDIDSDQFLVRGDMFRRIKAELEES